MKKLMTMACAMIMAIAANASEVVTVAFNKTSVNVPARVRFVKGDMYGFRVESKDAVLARALQCSVKDGVLRFTFGETVAPGESKYDAKKNTFFYGVNNNGDAALSENVEEDLVITITSPVLPEFNTSADFITETVTEIKDMTGASLASNK